MSRMLKLYATIVNSDLDHPDISFALYYDGCTKHWRVNTGVLLAFFLRPSGIQIAAPAHPVSLPQCSQSPGLQP